MTTTTWVLLRGLTRDARHWGGFVERFAAAPGVSAVVAIDLPGNGVLNDERSPATVAGLLAHCRAQLTERRLPPPYGVFAMSLGAMVALQWAATAPGELRAAVLVNTSIAGLTPWHRRLRPASAATLAWLLARSADGDDWEAAILRLTTRHPLAPDTLLRTWQAYRRERPVRAANAWRQLLAAARFRLPPQPLSVPLLLLAGAADRLVDVRCSRALAARCLTATLVEHPTAGHDLPVDDADWVIGNVARWAQGATTGESPSSAQPRGSRQGSNR